tara:strand:+ start:254 stop:709 length:456 start_codon:yes stop_codon:yes gene_type:complete
MVEAVVTVGDLGSSDTTTVQASFPASPIYTGELTDDGVTEEGQALLLDGAVNDAGHTFGVFERDYTEAPDYGDVEAGGGGLPASAWAPNPVSPGPGSMNPSDQADPPDGFGQTPNDQWGSGVGSQLNPAESSAAQSTQTLGDYVMGKAPSA